MKESKGLGGIVDIEEELPSRLTGVKSVKANFV